MISALIREFLIPLVIFLFLRALLRGFLASFRRPITRPSATQPPPPSRTTGVLHKDPVCGTYVAEESALTRSVNGHAVYFCSAQCRDRYGAPS